MPNALGRCAPLLLLALLVACSDESPTTPGRLPAPPDLGRAAFRLTIDVATGRITVDGPRGAAHRVRGSGPSLSLVGSEAIALHATDCTWSSIPSNSRQRRCSFDLAVENRLGYTDLVTPTTFPKPPAGTSGVLVFPYTAAALGVPGAAATPSADWNNAPTNFFNDFAGCSGKTSDCYRSETYPAPLYAGVTSAPRTVGFDVDKNAQSVSAYIVVAADLRDDPPQQVTVAPSACASVFEDFGGGSGGATGAVLNVGAISGATYRTFCRFAVAPTAGKVVTAATLRMYQEAVTGFPYTSLGDVVVDHGDYSLDLTEATFLNPPLVAANIGTLPADPTLEYKTLDVTGAVLDDFANTRGGSEFRLRVTGESGITQLSNDHVTFGTPAGPNPPQLLLTYRIP
jgi:hypothetical protein